MQVQLKRRTELAFSLKRIVIPVVFQIECEFMHFCSVVNFVVDTVICARYRLVLSRDYQLKWGWSFACRFDR